VIVLGNSKDHLSHPTGDRIVITYSSHLAVTNKSNNFATGVEHLRNVGKCLPLTHGISSDCNIVIVFQDFCVFDIICTYLCNYLMKVLSPSYGQPYVWISLYLVIS